MNLTMSILNNKHALHALGWVALWSTTMVQAVRHLPEIQDGLLWSFVLASIATLVILSVHRFRGRKSCICADGKARMTFVVSTILLVLPALIQRMLHDG